MTRIIDVSKVQEALDRAARDALRGPRDVRAGRFVATDAVAKMPARKLRPVKAGRLAARRGPRQLGHK
jgi:hypothetical protein